MSLSALLPPIWASSEGTAADPYFSDVVGLFHFDGTNGSTTFTDSSSHAVNLTNNGTVAISTAQSQFGGASLLCGGSGNNGASGNNNIYKATTSDFTIEFWVRPNSITPRQNLLFFNSGGGQDGFYSTATTGTVVAFLNNSAQITSSATLAANTWTFIAYSRIGSSGVLYVGGNSQGSWSDTRNYLTGIVCAGELLGGDSHTLAGYIDDFRFTIGVGRYSGSTCPIPSAPFPNS